MAKRWKNVTLGDRKGTPLPCGKYGTTNNKFNKII